MLTKVISLLFIKEEYFVKQYYDFLLVSEECLDNVSLTTPVQKMASLSVIIQRSFTHEHSQLPNSLVPL